MARSFLDADNDYIYGSAAANLLSSAYGVTIAAWVKPNSGLAAFEYWPVATIGSDSGAPNISLEFATRSTGNAWSYLRMVNDAAETDTVNTTDNAYSADVWYHLAAVSIGQSDRRAYWNGGNEGQDTDTHADDYPNTQGIGISSRRADIGGNVNFDGDIAEVAFWNVALTQTEIQQLAAGFSPLLVRPESLVAYCPLVRDEDRDVINGVLLSNVGGTPGISDHVPIYYPAPKQVLVPSVTALPDTNLDMSSLDNWELGPKIVSV